MAERAINLPKPRLPGKRVDPPWEQVSGPKEPHNVPTGARLRARREAQGVTATALAMAAGLEPATVEAVETGTVTLVAPREHMSDALHVLAGTGVL